MPLEDSQRRTARAEARRTLYPLYRLSASDVVDPLAEVRKCMRDGTVVDVGRADRNDGSSEGADAPADSSGLSSIGAGHMATEPLVVFWLSQKEDEIETPEP